MPIFMIERDFVDQDSAAVESAALRALACSYRFDDLRWIRSFADEERHTITCVYEAASEEDIREHARVAMIPCGDVRAVTEIGPEMFEGRETEGAVEPTTSLIQVPSATRDGEL